MSLNDKSPDNHIAYNAAIEGTAAASASLAVLGRYWWNLQMQFLKATRTMWVFKAHWWLFLILGFLLLAFVPPLGLAFVVSAFCAGVMDPKAKDDFIVPLRQMENTSTVTTSDPRSCDPTNHHQPSRLEDVRISAGLHHAGYLNAIKRDVSDSEFAAAALGAFDGTLQAYGMCLSDLDMHTNGMAFFATQLEALRRKEDVNPDWLAEVMEEAMTSGGLEEIRTEAGRFAYTMEGAMRGGSDRPTS